MRIFNFDKSKYGFELMMDLYPLENIKESHFEPNSHTIDFYEILFLENSSGTIYLNNYSTDLLPYTIVFASPNQIKKNKILGAEGYHLVFKDDFLASFFLDKLFVHRLQFFYNTVNPQFFQISETDYMLIKKILEEIRTEITNYRADSMHIIRALLYFVLSKLNRLYSSYYDLSSETQADNEVYRFKEAVEKNIRTYQKVAEYAELLNINRISLNKIVKKYTGFTLQYIIHSRLIQEIKTELIYSDKTINEIGFELGFSEANNLSRFFINKEGISPSEFRRKSK